MCFFYNFSTWKLQLMIINTIGLEGFEEEDLYSRSIRVKFWGRAYQVRIRTALANRDLHFPYYRWPSDQFDLWILRLEIRDLWHRVQENWLKIGIGTDKPNLKSSRLKDCVCGISRECIEKTFAVPNWPSYVCSQIKERSVWVRSIVWKILLK